MLKIEGLNVRYRNRKILEGIDLELNRKEIVSIAGPNGAGKSTLLKSLVGIVKPEGGNIFIDGRESSRFSSIARARCIGYMPQNSPSRFPITVFDVVLMGRRPYINWHPSSNDLEIVEGLLKSIKIEHIAFRDCNKLSGGEKQKVLLARTFAQDADYLLLDEPTSNLDLKHQYEIMDIIFSMTEKKAMGVIVAMHDLNLASRYSHRIVMLNNGNVFCAGKPSDVVTANNIKVVYDIDMTITHINGYPHIMPNKPKHIMDKPDTQGDD